MCIIPCYNVYELTMAMCKVLIKNIFGHEIKLLTILLYRDSIFTIQDFAFSKKMIEI